MNPPEEFTAFVQQFLHYCWQQDPSMTSLRTERRSGSALNLLADFPRESNLPKTLTIQIPDIHIARNVMVEDCKYLIYETVEELFIELEYVCPEMMWNVLERMIPKLKTLLKFRTSKIGSIFDMIAVRVSTSALNLLQFLQNKFSQPVGTSIINIPMFTEWMQIISGKEVLLEELFFIVPQSPSHSTLLINYGVFYLLTLSSLSTMHHSLHFPTILLINLFQQLDTSMFDMNAENIPELVSILDSHKATLVASLLNNILQWPVHGVDNKLLNNTFLQWNAFWNHGSLNVYKATDRRERMRKMFLDDLESALHQYTNQAATKAREYYTQLSAIFRTFFGERSLITTASILTEHCKSLHIVNQLNDYEKNLHLYRNPVCLPDSLIGFINPSYPHMIRESALDKILASMKVSLQQPTDKVQWYHNTRYIKLFLLLNLLQSVKEAYTIPLANTVAPFPCNLFSQTSEIDPWINIRIPFSEITSGLVGREDSNTQFNFIFRIYSFAKNIFETFQTMHSHLNCISAATDKEQNEVFKEVAKAKRVMETHKTASSSDMESSSQQQIAIVDLNVFKEDTVEDTKDYALFKTDLTNYFPLFNDDKASFQTLLSEDGTTVGSGFGKNNNYLAYLVESQANKLHHALSIVSFCYDPKVTDEEVLEIFTREELTWLVQSEVGDDSDIDQSSFVAEKFMTDIDTSEIIPRAKNRSTPVVIPTTTEAEGGVKKRKRKRKKGDSNPRKRRRLTIGHLKRNLIKRDDGYLGEANEDGDVFGASLVYKRTRTNTSFRSYLDGLIGDSEFHVLKYSNRKTIEHILNYNCDFVSSVYDLLASNHLPDDTRKYVLQNLSLHNSYRIRPVTPTTISPIVKKLPYEECLALQASLYTGGNLKYQSLQLMGKSFHGYNRPIKNTHQLSSNEMRILSKHYNLIQSVPSEFTRSSYEVVSAENLSKLASLGPLISLLTVNHLSADSSLDINQTIKQLFGETDSAKDDNFDKYEKECYAHLSSIFDTFLLETIPANSLCSEDGKRRFAYAVNNREIDSTFSNLFHKAQMLDGLKSKVTDAPLPIHLDTNTLHLGTISPVMSREGGRSRKTQAPVHITSSNTDITLATWFNEFILVDLYQAWKRQLPTSTNL